jgi:hypothetical protein
VRAEVLERFLGDGEEVGTVVGGLGETAIADLIVDVVAGVEPADGFGPVGKGFVAF